MDFKKIDHKKPQYVLDTEVTNVYCKVAKAFISKLMENPSNYIKIMKKDKQVDCKKFIESLGNDERNKESIDDFFNNINEDEVEYGGGEKVVVNNTNNYYLIYYINTINSDYEITNEVLFYFEFIQDHNKDFILELSSIGFGWLERKQKSQIKWWQFWKW